MRPPESSLMGVDIELKIDDLNSMSFREESLYSFIQDDNLEGVQQLLDLFDSIQLKKEVQSPLPLPL